MGEFLHFFSPGFPLQGSLLIKQVAGVPNSSPLPQCRMACSQVIVELGAQGGVYLVPGGAGPD